MMFRLVSKGEGYLFASRELREVLEAARTAMSREVDSFNPDRLLQSAKAILGGPTGRPSWRRDTRHSNDVQLR
jgi:hypothetical protein